MTCLSFRSGFRRLAPALVLSLISAALGATEPPPPSLAGLQMTGPDLEVRLSAPPSPGVLASAVLLDAAGNVVAGASVEVEDGEARAVLAGALAQLATHPPAWRVELRDDDGVVLGDPLPFLVALRCPPGEACRFRLLAGLTAPGAALVDPALGSALDGLPAAVSDQLAAVVAADPSLRGAALTASWYWATLSVAPKACRCFWTLEPSLPGESGGGVVAGVTAHAASREDGVQIEQSRSAALALRQRCVQAEVQPAEAVTVTDEEGSWSAVLEIPRVALNGCPALCTPEVLWEADVTGGAVAGVDGGPGASAGASWEGRVEVDGNPVLETEEEASAVSGAAASEASRSESWAGSGQRLTVRTAAWAEMAVPGGVTDAGAVAVVDWHLAGHGESDCALPGQVEVTAASPSRNGPLHWDVPRGHCEPGHIGILLTDGRLCSPGRRK